MLRPSPFAPGELVFPGRPSIIAGRWTPASLPGCDAAFSMTRQSGGVIPDDMGGTGLALTEASIGWCAGGVLAYTGTATPTVARPDVAVRSYIALVRCEPRASGGIAWGPGAPLGVGVSGEPGAQVKTPTAATTGSTQTLATSAASAWTLVAVTLRKTGGMSYGSSTARTWTSVAGDVAGSLGACTLGIGGTTTDGPVVLGGLWSVAGEISDSWARVLAWFDAVSPTWETGLPWWDIAGCVAAWPLDGSLDCRIFGAPGAIVPVAGREPTLTATGLVFPAGGKVATATRAALAGNAIYAAYRRKADTATGEQRCVTIGSASAATGGVSAGRASFHGAGDRSAVINGVGWATPERAAVAGELVQLDYDGATLGITTGANPRSTATGVATARSGGVMIGAGTTTATWPFQGTLRELLIWARTSLTTTERARLTAWLTTRPWTP